MPQGSFISRRKVEKNPTFNSTSRTPSHQNYLTINDLKLGASVVIYSRTFHIVDCNDSTKRYVRENYGWGAGDLQVGEYPEDFISRRKVEKNPTFNSTSRTPSHQNYLTINDLKLGASVVIYSRTFHIVDCNDSTKRYVRENYGWGAGDLQVGEYPEDQFSITNHAKMIRETGFGVGINRNRKMHEMKEFMEAQLGKPTSKSDLGSFLRSGNSTLCFEVVWDDTDRLYGDVKFFKLYYFLADDTTEIVPIHFKNDGRDQFPKLLKRMKLPLQPNNPATSHYTWRNLMIGGTVNVYSRKMLITKADGFTRNFYMEKGTPLQGDLVLDRGVEVDFKREVPPYNGFGSEEDSLRR